MPVSKKDIQWKDYENKDTFYRGLILELLMSDPDKAYTIEELRAYVASRIGPDAAQKDTSFEGNIRAALMDPRIAFTLMDGAYYYSLMDNPPKR
jgi:hypothetical protein